MPRNDSGTLGPVLRRYRLAAGLSQEALAARANMSARAISDLERGLHRTPHADTFDRLANALTLSAPQRALLLAAARPDLGAPAEHAPQAPLDATPSALPKPPSAMIGRQAEYAHALAFLESGGKRLLTITGPGGVGKTRLALQLAHDLDASFANGALVVELAPIGDARLVPAAIAQALGLREQADISMVRQVTTCIGEQRMLLVLDNFEHLIEAAPFVAELLARCPNLMALATSRSPLRVRAEQTLALGPLALEDAVALFRERAEAVRPDSVRTEDDVAAICERVDHLPLAIELAAAQLRALSPTQLRTQLSDRLPLLRGGARDLPQRQQVMADAIAWSYELLSEPQQRFFRALGVFVGGWTLEAARALWREEGSDVTHDAILMLAALADASLIVAETQESADVRFSMLELIREYALDRLRAAGEEEQVRRRHAAYFADLAETAAALGPGQGVAGASMAVELPNARTALEWADARREAELGLRLAGFARLWQIRGAIEVAAAWTERMLALDVEAREEGAPTAPLTLRVARLYGFARILIGYGKLERAEVLATEAVELARTIGDDERMSSAFATLGMIAQAGGRLAAAEVAYTESYEHALRAQQSGLRSHALRHLSELERLRGDTARAEALLRDALAMARAAGDAWDVAMMAGMLGRLVQRQGQHDQARMLLRSALEALLAFGSPTYIAWCLEALAVSLCAEDEYKRAARLCAAAATFRERARTPLPPSERDDYEQVIAVAQSALGGATFAAEWAAGSALTQAAAVTEALESPPIQRQSAVDRRRPLSSRATRRAR